MTPELRAACDRVLLVGECNPYGGHDDNALVCWPAGCAGDRLRRIMGLDEETYLALGRRNLLHLRELGGKAWSARLARDYAATMLCERATDAFDAPRWPVIVALGAKVAAAFETLFERAAINGDRVASRDFRPWGISRTEYQQVLVLPHPSGRSRAWHEPGAVDRARVRLAYVAPDVPWGSFDGETPLAMRRAVERGQLRG